MVQLNYSKQIDIRVSTDVLVVGGGPAGCAAAWAAAKSGAKVFLAEGLGCLGGLGTAGMVPAYMQFGDGVNDLSSGFGSALFNRLKVLGEQVRQPQLAFEIRAENLKRVSEEMLEEAGVEFVFHTQLIDVITSGGTVEAAVFAAKSGVFAVKAKTYVDCTGDGDLSAWAGAPYEMGDENGHVMASTLCQLWANIDWDNVRKPDDRELDRAIADGVFAVADKHLPGMWKISHVGGIGGNIGHVYDADATDERSLTKGLIYGRKLTDSYLKYYSEYLTGYERMELVATGSILGIRESRRIIGEELMVLDHFHTQAVFANEIGRYAYPVDIHAGVATQEAFEKFHKEHTSLRYTAGQSYGIPYGALVPKKLNNVLVAGRCVSSDRAM
jgi:flavin-dependent dehydrogenase